jgi:DNA-binding transcriptional LysR family regulator
MISTQHLAHALALAKHLNFGRAAKAVNLTQPALSLSIQALERQVGVRLFDRGSGGVAPTAYGKLLVERAQKIVQDVDDLEREVELMRDLKIGTLDLVLGPYASALSGHQAIAKLVAIHPTLQCRVRVEGFRVVAEEVAFGDCDLGIAEISVAEELDLKVEMLATWPLFFVCRPGHQLLSGTSRTLSDLLAYPWAAIRVGKRLAEWLPESLAKAGRWDPVTGDFLPAFVTDVVSDFSVLARESDVIVATALSLVEEELAQGTLAVVPFSEPWLRFNYGFISRPGRTLSRVTEHFMAIVREIETEVEQREAELRGHYVQLSPG